MAAHFAERQDDVIRWMQREALRAGEGGGGTCGGEGCLRGGGMCVYGGGVSICASLGMCA